MAESYKEGRQDDADQSRRHSLSTTLVYAAATAVFISSVNSIYNSVVRNPVNDLDQLHVKFSRHVEVYDSRIDDLDREIMIIKYQIGECQEKLKR